MKNTVSKTILLCSLLALAGISITPNVRAQIDDAAKKEKADKKAKRDAEIVKKYDRNANGKLDPDEEAELKAAQEKTKAEKKDKKEKKPS